MDPNMKELKVSAIENGTVIDHIPSSAVFQVIKILKLDCCNFPVTFGLNLESKKYGNKGIIKVSNKFFEASEIDKISLVAPHATLITIKNFQVVEKRIVEIPEQISGIVKCFNPNCVTNIEKVTTRFTVIEKEDLRLKCHYCEKITVKNNLAFK